jgi:hypothetical protein
MSHAIFQGVCVGACILVGAVVYVKFLSRLIFG